jgi:uncharacterized membrane protein
MAIRVHELHPMLVHAPLVMLPAAATVDLLSVGSSGRLRRSAYSAIGRKLWWGTAVSGLAAGLAGMASSQEVDADDHARDMMLVHGLGNVTLVVAALGLAVWRTTHRATPLSAGLGAGAMIAATYTAWLGGEMVYSHGVGVKARDEVAADPLRSPPLLSRHAPAAFARDAARGLAWLLRRGAASVRGRDRVRLEAVSPRSAAPSDPQLPSMH